MVIHVGISHVEMKNHFGIEIWLLAMALWLFIVGTDCFSYGIGRIWGPRWGPTFMKSRAVLSAGLSRFAAPIHSEQSEDCPEFVGPLYRIENGTIKWSEGLPSRAHFQQFYSDSIRNHLQETLNLQQISLHPHIQQLLQDKYIDESDIESIWDSYKPMKMDASSCYEFLCTLIDLPDPELIDFLNTSFHDLCTNNANGDLGVTLQAFLQWPVVQEVLDDESITRKKVEDIWRKVVADDTDSMETMADRRQFGVMHKEIENIINSLM